LQSYDVIHVDRRCLSISNYSILISYSSIISLLDYTKVCEMKRDSIDFYANGSHTGDPERDLAFERDRGTAGDYVGGGYQ
jgi:hypothetical protein